MVATWPSPSPEIGPEAMLILDQLDVPPTLGQPVAWCRYPSEVLDPAELALGGVAITVEAVGSCQHHRRMKGMRLFFRSVIAHTIQAMFKDIGARRLPRNAVSRPHLKSVL